MSTTELSEEIEGAIAAHDLSESHAARVRELVEEGVPVLDAIKQAGQEETPPEEIEDATDDAAAGLDQPTPAMMKALAKENERHVKAVRKVMGGFVEGFEPCSTCDALGLEPPTPKAKPHPFFKECETCNGYGQVLTGSRDEANLGRACPDCGGRGYLEAMLDNTPAVEIVEQIREQRRAAATQPPPPPVVVEQEVPAADVSFGRPAWMGDVTLAP